ncbi:hypothetical protein, partial [Acinetobacter bereziniae]
RDAILNPQHQPNAGGASA